MKTKIQQPVLTALALLLGLSCVPKVLYAVDHVGPIKISLDPSDPSSFSLLKDDTFTFQGSGAAIEVGQGGNFTSTDAELNFEGTGTLLHGLNLTGGQATLSGGTLKAIGNEVNLQMSNNSRLTMTDTTVQITRQSAGFPAPNNALDISGGSSATLTNVVFISDATSNRPSKALSVSGANSLLSFDGGSITASATLVHASLGGTANISNTALHGGSVDALLVEHNNSKLTLDKISYTTGYGIDAISIKSGAHADISNSTLSTAGDGVRIHNSSSGSVLNINDTTIKTTGDGVVHSSGLSVGSNSSATIGLNNVTIASTGNSILMSDTYGKITGKRVTLTSTHSPTLRLASGEVALSDSAISINNLSGKSISAVHAGLSGAKAHLTATNSDITAQGSNASALRIEREGSAHVKGGTVNATKGASGAIVIASGKLHIEGAQLKSEGIGVQALTSVNMTPTLEISKGASLQAQTALMLSSAVGTELRVPISDSDIVGTGPQGLLHASSGGGGSINLDVKRSRLTGSVSAAASNLKLNFNDSTVFTGEVQGTNTTLALGANSHWKVRGSSTLQSLDHSASNGMIEFMLPASPGSHKKISVRDYVGGGQIILHTQIGHDNSPTDQLVIDGGTATGNSLLKVLNTGGQGAATIQGIPVIHTVNNATSSTDLFSLHSESTGYRASAQTLAIQGYDYSLIRGGANGTPDSWYLSSVVSSDPTPTPDPNPNPNPNPDPSPSPDPTPTPTPDPSPDPNPEPPVTPERPPKQTFTNVSPETGSFIGNQLVATQMFNLSLQDRETKRQSENGRGSTLWGRVKASHNTGTEMLEGYVRVKSDQYVIQLGGDILHKNVGKQGQFVAGLMIGYGDSQVTSTSSLKGISPDGQLQTKTARTDGKVKGYSAGIYATWFANQNSKLGGYVDSWLQFGRYSNKINSELGHASYHANAWLGSLELGYAFQTSKTYSLVIEPQTQVRYSHYNTTDAAELPTMQLKSGNKSRIDTRLGVRLYPLGKLTKLTSFSPYAEVNWLHRTGEPSVIAGPNEFKARALRNAAELKLGAEGRINESFFISGQASAYYGTGNQRNYSGQLNLNYRW